MTADPKHIVQKIRSSPKDRKEIITMIASNQKLKTDIINYILRNSGTQDDGIMVFHDSIVAFVKKCFTDQNFTLSTSLEAYIFGIAKFNWLAKIRKEKKYSHDDIQDHSGLFIEENNIQSQYATKEKSILLKKAMEHLRSSCKEVLMYWAGGFSMKEIASLLNYKSEGMARKKKHQCFKQLIEWLDARPHIKEELK